MRFGFGFSAEEGLCSWGYIRRAQDFIRRAQDFIRRAQGGGLQISFCCGRITGIGINHLVTYALYLATLFSQCS